MDASGGNGVRILAATFSLPRAAALVFKTNINICQIILSNVEERRAIPHSTRYELYSQIRLKRSTGQPRANNKSFMIWAIPRRKLTRNTWSCSWN